MKKYKFLLVDDESTFCETFRDKISRSGDAMGISIRVDDVQCWDDAALQIRSEQYDAVILDAKCLCHRDQEVEDFAFLGIALEGIGEIEREMDQRLPVAINTGYLGEREMASVERLLKKHSIRKFSKTDANSGLLTYLLGEVDAAAEKWITYKYKDVFEVFDSNLLGNGCRQSLISVLMTHSDHSKIRENLRAIRVVQEQIYRELEARKIYSLSDIPTSGGGELKYREKNTFLGGGYWYKSKGEFVPTSAVFQTKTITRIAEAIFDIASNYGAHDPKPRPSNVEVKYWNEPSAYVVTCLTFGLLEQILWLKSLLKS